MEENYKLQELIETKSFDELTTEEKSVVLQEISEEEYTLRRSVIENTRLFLSHGVKTSKADDQVFSKAKSILSQRQQTEKSGFIHTLFTYKIPAFIPIAATLLLLLTLPFVLPGDYSKKHVAAVTDTVHRVVYKTDTVVLEKEVIKKVNIPVVKYVSKPAPATTIGSIDNQGTDRVVTTDPMTIVTNTKNQLKNQFTQMGRSSGDTDAFDALNKMRDTLIYQP